MPPQHQPQSSFPGSATPVVLADRALVGAALAEPLIGILHEFRNHLTLLLSSSGWLRGRLEDLTRASPEMGEAMRDVDESIERMVALTGGLDGALRAPAESKPTLDRVVKTAVMLAEPLLKSRGRITVRDLLSIAVLNRRGSLESAMALLIVAAADQAPEPPAVAIAVATRQAEAGLMVEISCGRAARSADARAVDVARALLARVGGTLNVNDNRSGGPRFTITLPHQ